MQERFLAYNREKKLLEKNDKILCAVSGGIDSIVMAHLFIEAGYNISIAHVNHKKRGKESDEDALFVKNYAKANEIPYFEMTLKEPKSSQNFQEYAREERYKWFQLLVKENGISKIATAHHKDDVIETFLFNAMRGSGINGLTSIQVKNNNIIRPILCFTKQEIEDYATKNNLSYREDSSNSENKYARNKIRNILIPSFTETNNNALKGLSNTIEVINDEAILLQELIKNAKKKWITNLGAKLFIDLNKIGKFKGKLSLLHYLTIDFGFTKDQLSNILSLPTNGSIFETKTHLAVKHQNLLEIIKLEDVDKIMPLEITREGEYNYGDYLLRIELVDAVNIEYGEGVHYLGFDKNPFPILLRSWEKGDTFKPFGMKGKSQSLKKYFVNEKLSVLEKSSIPILVKNRQILGLVSMRISEENKVTNESNFVLKISWQKNNQ